MYELVEVCSQGFNDLVVESQETHLSLKKVGLVHVQDRGVAGIGHIRHDLFDAIHVAAVELAGPV